MSPNDRDKINDPSEPASTDTASDSAAKRSARMARAAAEAARKLDRSEPLVNAVRLVREHLPGDRQIGDPLSVAERKHFAIAQRQLSDITGSDDGVVRELSGGALQVWQAFLTSRQQDAGAVDVTLLFTDLVGFSTWALAVGDDAALDLLRAVSTATEPPVTANRGQVVKRLGDGMMAAFPTPQDAFDAVADARLRLAAIESTDGWRPRLRAGIHAGRPRRIAGDFLGVDVNIAARLVERAAADEILVSGAAVKDLDRTTATWRRKKSFALLKVKGVPDGLEVYSVTPRPS